MNSAMIKWRTDSSDILYDTYNMIYVCTWRLPVHGCEHVSLDINNNMSNNFHLFMPER